MATNMTAVIAGTTQPLVCRSMIVQLAAISTQAAHLAPVETARFCSQAMSTAPNRGCSYSQRCSAGDPRAADQAASSRNGVVGSSGRNAPATPSAMLTYASAR